MSCLSKITDLMNYRKYSAHSINPNISQLFDHCSSIARDPIAEESQKDTSVAHITTAPKNEKNINRDD